MGLFLSPATPKFSERNFSRARMARYDVTMCIVEIRPGQGGADAGEFARNLGESVCAWAGRGGHEHHLSASGRMVTVTLPDLPAAALG
jgi:PCRF domain